MALTKDFKETVRARVQRDPEFRAALLAGAVECFVNNEAAVAKITLRNYVNATIGFQGLAALMDKKPESLMRMLSKKGNPTFDNFATLISILSEREGISLQVGFQSAKAS